MDILHKSYTAPLFAALSSLLFFNKSFGQNISVNKIYPDIAGVQISGNNEIWSVYPDSNRIYVVGQGVTQDGLTMIFTAAFDYSGNKIWEKNLNIPPALKPTVVGYHNLIKLNPDLYVAGGNLSHYPLNDSTIVSEPFLYFFDRNGDSVNYISLVDSNAARWLTTLANKPDSGFVVGGIDSVLHLTDSTSNNSDSSIFNYWFTDFRGGGYTFWSKKISIQSMYLNTTSPGIIATDNEITNIFPVSGDSVKYLLGTKNYNWDPFGVSYMIETDSNFRWLGRYEIGMGDYTFPWGYMFTHHFGPTQPFNIITDGKEVPKSYFYTGIAEIWSDDYSNDYMGAYYAKVDTPKIEPPLGHGIAFPLGILPEYDTWTKALGHEDIRDSVNPPEPPHTVFPFPFYTYPPHNDPLFIHRYHLLMAKNGDLFMEKLGVVLPDTAHPNNWPFDLSLLQPLVPFLMRADTNDGHLEWMMPIEYNSQARDTSIKQYFNDMAVAPSGCIVMGGSVNVKQLVPGYDSLGKNSWLVVLCDSVHDHNPTAGIQIPEAGNKAEVLVYPNPTTENAFVVLKHFQGNLQNVGIQLCDFNGRVLQHQKCHSEKVLIRLNNYASGIYLIKVLYKGKPSGTVKLVKD